MTGAWLFLRGQYLAIISSCLLGGINAWSKNLRVACHRGLFPHVFFTFLSNFKTFFLSFHTLTNHEHQDKTQENIVLVQRNKHRLPCTQDGLPQDDLTASSYRLIILGDTWTPTMTADAVQVLYSCLSLLIPLLEDESSSEVPLSETIGGGIKISPT